MIFDIVYTPQEEGGREHTLLARSEPIAIQSHRPYTDARAQTSGGVLERAPICLMSLVCMRYRCKLNMCTRINKILNKTYTLTPRRVSPPYHPSHFSPARVVSRHTRGLERSCALRSVIEPRRGLPMPVPSRPRASGPRAPFHRTHHTLFSLRGGPRAGSIGRHADPCFGGTRLLPRSRGCTLSRCDLKRGASVF